MTVEKCAAKPFTPVALATATVVALGAAVVVVVPLWPALVVVVRAAVVVVVETAAPPPATVVVVPALAAVVVVVAGVLLTLGRVPTDTRTATATTKRIRTAAARTIESEPDDPVPDGGVCDWSSSM
jgi:hypothetical protein